MGCFALIMAIEMLPSVIWFFWGDPDLKGPGYAAAVFIPCGLLAGFGLWLLLRRPSPDAPQPGGPPLQGVSATAAEVRTSLLLAAGMLIIGLTMEHYMVAAFKLAMAYMPDQGQSNFLVTTNESKASLWLSAVASCIPMILGLVLVLWGSAVGGFLLRRWSRARPEAADEQCPHCGYWIQTGEYRPGAPAYRCDNCKQELPRSLFDTRGTQGQPE
jgi:hypothetical protein